ncbi:aldehyde dehydrogenase 1A1-like [Ruditapes philippinarum]|uniref:aldehyde dehydrogenase 1A1-like n=1 Tax=Ruditapes philippinarum TaxID=129788 RepID=UPI00295B4117|nr:aldehyde dehydrogenase 1A1-like [Ruditapes philippinarum]
MEFGSPWQQMDASKRGVLLRKLADLLERDKLYLCSLESLDSGKVFMPLYAFESGFVADMYRYFAGWTDKIQGRTIPIEGAYFCYTRHEPVGVCGQIIPWNFPMAMFAMKVAPAVACGNTVVVKPAEQATLSSLYMGKLAIEAGFPPGVINVVPGFGQTAGAALSSHPNVNKVSFTGSTQVGQAIMGARAKIKFKNEKPLGRLGGKSHFFFFGKRRKGNFQIFGPVQSIMKFKDMEEIVARANDTKYGLAGAIFTEDIDTAMTFTSRVKAGTVWVNCYLPMSPAAPFGGFKMVLLLGRELGEYCLQAYTEIKTVVMKTSVKL